MQPTETIVACVPYQLDEDGAPTASADQSLGTAVAIAHYGDDPSDESDRRIVIAGGPHPTSSSAVGSVLFTRADATSSELLHTPASRGALTEACGQEVLIGAPDNGPGPDGQGAFEWWHASELNSSDWDFVFGERVGAPGSVSVKGEFGYALAADDALFDPTQPWVRSPNATPWLAVGAPADQGDGRVHLYEVDATQPSPFTYVGVLAPPAGASVHRFGHALEAIDFDDDGHLDLVVAAPGAPGLGSGWVFVYRGGPVAAAGPLRLFTAASDVVALSGPMQAPQPPGWSQPTDDAFGAALAAGYLSTGPSASLLVGAPGTYEDQGYVCQFDFDQPGGPGGFTLLSSACHANPRWVNGTLRNGFDDARWGASLAIDNFVNVDSNGQRNTAEARVQEVAVGMPAARSIWCSRRARCSRSTRPTPARPPARVARSGPTNPRATW